MHSNNTQLNQRKIEVLVNIYEKITLRLNYGEVECDAHKLPMLIMPYVIKLLPGRFDDKNLSLLIDGGNLLDAVVQNSFITMVSELHPCCGHCD